MNYNIHRKSIILFLVFTCSVLFTYGQMSLRTQYSWKGQYDITMISSMVLQPVFLNYGTSSDYNFDVIRGATTEEQLACGDALSMNNRIGGGRGIEINDAGLLAIAPAACISGGNAKVALAYADCDDDMSTFQSSAAYLDFGAEMSCTTVAGAYLYWTGALGTACTYNAYPGTPTMKSHAGGATGSAPTPARNTIKFKAPGDVTYTDVTGTMIANSGGSTYTNVADVTALVAGKSGGLYWCANVRSETNTTSAGSGWSLIVIFEPPNCPSRVINIWDGNVSEGSNVTYNFNAGEVPAAGNSNSYLGFAGLDAEDLAINLDPDPGYAKAMASNITFKSNIGATAGPTVIMQPFTDGDQPAYTLFDNDGTLLNDAARDGIVSSQLTTYNKNSGTNGNQLIRIPATKYTAGYDAHHMKLPAGAIGALATSATITLPDEQFGGSTAFMAYMAFETLDTHLEIDKTSNITTTSIGDTIEYTLTVKNIGEFASQPGAYIVDTLDLPVDYIDPSATFYNSAGSVILPPTPTEYSYDDGAATKDVNERLKFYLPTIAATSEPGNALDSITITFQVKVKDMARTDIWASSCHRIIKNKASLFYESMDGNLFSTSSAGSSGCEGNNTNKITEVEVEEVVAAYNTTHNKTFDISATPTANVQTRVRADLQDQGFTALEASMFIISDANKNIISAALTFKPTYTTEIFTATTDLGAGCLEVYTFTYQDFNPERSTGVRGFIYHDLNSNCQNESEAPMAETKVIIQPGNIVTQSNEIGSWFIDSLALGIYTATVDTTNQDWELTCPNNLTFEIKNSDSLIYGPSFGFKYTKVCTQPRTSIYSISLRRCFSDQYIYITASNDAKAASVLTNPYVDIKLDTLLAVNSMSHSYTEIDNNVYRVAINDLSPGELESIKINTTVSCDAVLGQTLCMQATLYPIDSCSFSNSPAEETGEVTPCTLPWDKSSLKVIGKCTGDSIKFTILNTGEVSGGDMDCFSPVRVFVDGNIYLRDSIRLQGQEIKTYTFDGTGQTWRLEADQHPLHPGKSRPNASIERCGDASNWTPGLITTLPQDDIDPVTDIYCGMVRGSFDPNDKQGFPLGINDTHDILPNQDLEYLIRFQNTGTDTAFTVVIRDTLDKNLNIFSIEDGASSHSAVFKMYGPRILEWTFNNILLPDSTTDLKGSNGFVSFKVSQVNDLAKGTEIKNKAAIYFDYNEPVITNQTVHTINPCINTLNMRTIEVDAVDSYFAPDGDTYTTSGIISYTIPAPMGCDSIININLRVANTPTAIKGEKTSDIIAFPNPFIKSFNIRFNDGEDNHTISIYDLKGKKIYQETTKMESTIISLGSISSGIYLLEIESEKTKSSYKLIKK